MVIPSVSKLSHQVLDNVGLRMRTSNRMFIANYTYKEVKAYYDKSIQESVYCKGVRYAREAGKKNVILKICDLYTGDERLIPDDRLTLSDFLTEAEYAKRASDIGIGPLVYIADVMRPNAEERGPTFGVIAMYKFDEKESLEQINNSFEREKRYHSAKHDMAIRCGDCRNVYDIDEQMGMAYQRALAVMWQVGGFMHMDLHQGNIFYHDQQIYFSDYGLVLPRSRIETASPEIPFEWSPRQLGRPIKITGLNSAYDTSAFDVISYMESVLSRYVSPEVIDLFVKLHVDMWPRLLYRIM